MRHCIIYPVHPVNDKTFRECRMEAYLKAKFDKTLTKRDGGDKAAVFHTNFYIFDPVRLVYWRVADEQTAEHYYRTTETAEIEYMYM